MANISRVTDRIYTGGDLPLHLGSAAMRRDVTELERLGITHVIDNRLELNDELYFAASSITYLWSGQDDAGQAMPDEWFDRGVAFALTALQEPQAQVFAHCHMGINRGPSMAYAILLATGHDPVEALTAIRTGRPIAAVGYAEDALSWWHRRSATPPLAAAQERRAMKEWRSANPIDVVRIIRQVRFEEDQAWDRTA